MKTSSDSTHPCQSPTRTVNGCDLTQTCEQESIDLADSNRRLQHCILAALTKAFHEDPVVRFLDVHKIRANILGFRDFSKIWSVVL